MTQKSKTQWDDRLVENKFFTKLSWFVPGYILWTMSPLIFENYPQAINIIQVILSIYMVIVVIFATNAFLNTLVNIYESYAISKDIPIKGYVQVIKIFVVLTGIIIIIARLLGYNPLSIIGGMGAFTAILLLVFKDPILGFVGGIQLTANSMLKPGDWIVMPKYHVDGIVTDIALTTVKVQNWDKTISTIPTYSLISDSFKNWRGMEESNARRIKRSLNIDVKSIRFANKEMLEKYKTYDYLKEYVSQKEVILEKYNTKNKIDNSILVNGRRQTNIGIFRHYLLNYLRHHPDIHQDMTLMVRQLAPTEKGLPLEIYVFSKVLDWVEYEAIQSDIFDHILSVVPHFDLRVFQNPSGYDFEKLAR
jgi:miniconductance mechanosensitive channel